MSTGPSLKSWSTYCDYCEEYKSFSALYDYSASGEAGHFVFTLLGCPDCESPALVVQEAMPSGSLDSPTQVYPNHRQDLIWAAPKQVREAYREAVACFERAAAPTATAVMARRTLEALCIVHGVKGKDLSAKLQSLLAANVIDKSLHDWATELRSLGNDAAHGIEPVSREDAKDALGLVSAMLNYVYTYRQSFEEFKRRRKAARGRSKGHKGT